jgi:hypothetical protein
MAKPGRKRLPVELHVIKGSYRKDRHGALPQSPSEPPWEALSGNALCLAFAALPDEAQGWCEMLEEGTDIMRQLPREIDERQARRMARAKWQELGPVLVQFWGEKHARKTWAWRRFGPPDFVERAERKA